MTNNLIQRLRAYGRSITNGLDAAEATEAADALERLSRPYSEREPPHCPSCNCDVQSRLRPRSEFAAALHYALDEWSNAGAPTETVVHAVVDLIQHAIDSTACAPEPEPQPVSPSH